MRPSTARPREGSICTRLQHSCAFFINARISRQTKAHDCAKEPRAGVKTYSADLIGGGNPRAYIFAVSFDYESGAIGGGVARLVVRSATEHFDRMGQEIGHSFERLDGPARASRQVHDQRALTDAGDRA